MRIYNQEKTQEIQNPDLTLGYLMNDRLFIAHHEATPEIKMQGHVESFTNEFGLPDENFVIDVEYSPARDAWDEYANIQVYIPYTEEELNAKRIKDYEKFVEDLIRVKYSVSNELAILRQKETKPDEFKEYYEYAEQCKAAAKIALNFTED